MVVHISIAEQGETITALSERSKSVLKPEYVAVLNALDFNSPLSKGQMVKVIVEQAYQN